MAVRKLSMILFVACLTATGFTAVRAQTRFESLGGFKGRGGAMASMVAAGPGGSERYYVAYTYINSLDIVAYEPGGRTKVWESPEGGAWAMEGSLDGRIYIGTFPGGHILRL